MHVTIYLETTEITLSVWEQCQYVTPLVGQQASQGREWQPSVATRTGSIWEALYVSNTKMGQPIIQEGRQTAAARKHSLCFLVQFPSN